MPSRSFKKISVSMCLLFGFAQSQVNWQRFPSNPVVPLNGTPSFENTFSPSVLYDSVAGIYKMWFSSVLVGGSTWDVSYATSPNGTTWQVYSGSPVLRAGPSGSFDSRWLIDPFVMRLGNSYRMYYTGYDGSRWQTGLATSSDGVIWMKHSSNPILRVVSGSSWESIGANAPKVHFDGSTYRMMYSGYNGSGYSIGLATSVDGVNFTRHEANPVLRRGTPSEWDANSAIINSFANYNGKFYLLYNGGGSAPVGFATSTDGGMTWTKYPGNPVFSLGSPGSWDGYRIAIGSLMVTENQFRYWYTGTGDGSRWRIGYATGSMAPPTPPTIRVTPEAINFGVVPVGTVSQQPITIANLSFSDTLRVNIVSNNPVFLPPTPLTPPITIPPGGTFSGVPVLYMPTIARVDTGTLTITSNDPNRPTVLVRVSGQGFAPSALPLVSSIRDIPEDQGKQVRVTWYRSIYDGINDSLRVVQYNVWRRVGNTNLWDFIATIPAVRFEQYAFVAPTLFDSSRTGIRWSVFKVSAHTTGNVQVFFSAADSGYSVDNLPPLAPTNLIARLGTSGVDLSWDLPTDPDIDVFGLYRSTDPNFIPSEQQRIGTATSNSFVDRSIGGSSRYYYYVVAFDSTGNRSEPSNQANVIITDVQGGNPLPGTFQLHQNYPNPLNPSSIIRYDLPERSHVNIVVYDMLGKRMTTLVDEVMPAGQHDITFSAGQLASGVYLYRMEAGNTIAVKKLIVMK